MTKHPQTFANSPATAAEVPRRKRLLVVKLGAIGDVVMAIPAAAAMHAAGYAVDWVVSTTVAPILSLYPWIHVIPVDEANLLRAGLVQRIAHIFALWRVLRARVRAHGSYDVCAILYYDRRYRVLTLPIRARRHLLLSETDRSRRLLPGRHHTDEYARILAGGADGETATQLSPVLPGTLPVSPLPGKAGRVRAVLVPGGARNLLRDDALRRWPVENYVGLAELLLKQGCEVVLAGGTEDDWVSPHFAALANSAPGSFFDLTGTVSLVQMLALLDSADVTVTHDTGPLHLAGLTSTAIVTIFGPTDPHGRLPHRGNSVALWGGEGFACRPCYDGRDYAPCSHNGCIRQVTPSLVMEQVQLLLQARRQGKSLPPRVLAPDPAVLAQDLLWPAEVLR